MGTGFFMQIEILYQIRKHTELISVKLEIANE